MAYIKISGNVGDVPPIYHNSKAWLRGQVYEVPTAEHDQMIALGYAADNGSVADAATGNAIDNTATENVPLASVPQVALLKPSEEDQAS